MQELASLTIEAVARLIVVLGAELSLVVAWEMSLSYELVLVVSVRAVRTILAAAIHDNVAAHFCLFHFGYFLVEFDSFFLGLEVVLLMVAWTSGAGAVIVIAADEAIEVGESGSESGTFLKLTLK